MKNLFKVLAFGTMLAASSTLAYASPLAPGTLTIDGSKGAINPTVLNASTTSIHFSGLNVALGSTGSFSSVSTFSRLVSDT